MTEIKAIIVDDEQLGIDSLKWELSRLDSTIHILAVFTNPLEVKKFLENNSIDLMFLDIQMPQQTGFELLTSLNQIDFSVIFVTAYDQYAVKAFKFSALEYLLKPVEKEDLQMAINKFENYQSRFTPNPNQIQIHEITTKGGLPDKVVFATKESYEFLDPKDINFCKADSNYTTIFMNNSKLMVSKTLKEVELVLQEFNFLRIHHSYLINPTHIKRYLKTDGGFVIMDNDIQLPISRSRKEDFLKVILGK